MSSTRLEPWGNGNVRVHCRCGWSSKDLPFPDPDAAYHALSLHRAISSSCEGTDPKVEADAPRDLPRFSAGPLGITDGKATP